MKILNDQLGSESLRKLENYPDPLARAITNSLRRSLSIQKRMIEGIDIEPRKHDFFHVYIFYLFIKLRCYYRSIIGLIVDQN